TPEDVVEVGLINKECVVLGVSWTMVVGKVQRHVIVDLDHEEGSARRGGGQTQNVGQERRRLALVSRSDNRVIQPNRHCKTPWGLRGPGVVVEVKAVVGGGALLQRGEPGQLLRAVCAPHTRL